jgi:hypothetical protein
MILLLVFIVTRSYSDLSFIPRYKSSFMMMMMMMMILQSLFIQTFDISAIFLDTDALLYAKRVAMDNHVSPSRLFEMKRNFTYPAVVNGYAVRFRLTGGLFQLLASKLRLPVFDRLCH